MRARRVTTVSKDANECSCVVIFVVDHAMAAQNVLNVNIRVL